MWLTASFQLNRIEFTPLNILYCLIFYPLHTRIIQVWIHLEAVKLWYKNIPLFNHPNNADVDFGFGITGKGIARVLETVISAYSRMYAFLFSTSSKRSDDTSGHSTDGMPAVGAPQGLGLKED